MERKVSGVEDGIGAVFEWRDAARSAWSKYEARHIFDRDDAQDYADVQQERARLTAYVNAKHETMERLLNFMDDATFVQTVEVLGMKSDEGWNGIWERYRRIGE